MKHDEIRVETAWQVAYTWADAAKKYGWVKFGDDDWYDADELASSIYEYWSSKYRHKNQFKAMREGSDARR